MALPDQQFTTGPATLADVGQLQYNGCLFSPLFETKLTGTMMKDEAGRTTKCMEYTLLADGYVTLAQGLTDIADTMDTLRTLLQAQGGSLIYLGRGFNLAVNNQLAVGATNTTDVAWGPIPKLLEFQPLGGGRSAKIRWQVTTCIPEQKPEFHRARILQLNYETSLTYGEDGYSSMSIRGTLEIPLTRVPNQTTRTVPATADSYRPFLEDRILKGIDLSRFHVTRREFNTSRDKRTLTWDFAIEEKPYMDLPPGCTIARGSFNVRPAKAGMGLVNWLCTLKATYIPRADVSQRVAWLAFLWLLRVRMQQSDSGNGIAIDGRQNPATPNGSNTARIIGAVLTGGLSLLAGPIGNFLQGGEFSQAAGAKNAKRAFLIDFSYDEGLYNDSKSITFSATWRILTSFSNIFRASGLWTKVVETSVQGGNLWSIYMRDVQGVNSWLTNRLDPSLDVIVDFGSPI